MKAREDEVVREVWGEEEEGGSGEKRQQWPTDEIA